MEKGNASRHTLAVAAASVVTLLVAATVVQAATTIGSNITTAGTLSVTGVSTLTGDVTASGALSVTGATTLSSTLTVTPSSNSTAVLAIKNAASKPIFEVDTTNSRASTTALIIPQANSTSPRLNASSTAVSIGDGSPIAGLRFGTCLVDIPSTAASSTSYANCTATGVTTSDRVFVTMRATSTAIVFRNASSTANNTIQVSVYNTGYSNGTPAGTVNPDPTEWEWMAIR